jgi:hypothetical protein
MHPYSFRAFQIYQKGDNRCDLKDLDVADEQNKQKTNYLPS